MNQTLYEYASHILDNSDIELDSGFTYIIHGWQQGNFLVSTIQNAVTGKIISVGVAKRNPACDEWNGMRGDTIAFIRAVRQMKEGWEDSDDMEIELYD